MPPAVLSASECFSLEPWLTDPTSSSLGLWARASGLVAWFSSLFPPSTESSNLAVGFGFVRANPEASVLKVSDIFVGLGETASLVLWVFDWEGASLVPGVLSRALFLSEGPDGGLSVLLELWGSPVGTCIAVLFSFWTFCGISLRAALICLPRPVASMCWERPFFSLDSGLVVPLSREESVCSQHCLRDPWGFAKTTI